VVLFSLALEPVVPAEASASPARVVPVEPRVFVDWEGPASVAGVEEDMLILRCWVGYALKPENDAGDKWYVPIDQIREGQNSRSMHGFTTERFLTQE
jgi:hypothetical protein